MIFHLDIPWNNLAATPDVVYVLVAFATWILILFFVSLEHSLRLGVCDEFVVDDLGTIILAAKRID